MNPEQDKLKRNPHLGTNTIKLLQKKHGEKEVKGKLTKRKQHQHWQLTLQQKQ
jgi:uncharacterized protein YneF (UPF0154 family)